MGKTSGFLEYERKDRSYFSVDQRIKNFKEFINKNSLKIIKGKIEKSLKKAKPLDKFQFERIGYFCADNDYTKSYPIFNQTISLRGK